MNRLTLCAALLGPLLLGACAQNPMGDPVWSDWDHGAKPVAALDEGAQSASEPTGYIVPAPRYNQAPIESQPLGAPTPLQSSALPPPPAEAASSAGGDPYQPHYMRPAASPAAAQGGRAAETGLPQRTAPLAVNGAGTERSGSGE